MNIDKWPEKDREGYLIKKIIAHRKAFKDKRKADRLYKFNKELNISRVNGTNAGKINTAYVYIISNCNFPNWFKIGTCINLEARLSTYQTSDPTRSYKIMRSWVVEDRMDSEKAFIAYASRKDRYKVNGEWIYSQGINVLERDLLTLINNPAKLQKELQLRDNWISNKKKSA